MARGRLTRTTIDRDGRDDDPDRIETCGLYGDPEERPQLAAQIAEVEALRVEVGRLPKGTRIAWRDESMTEEAEGTITDASADYGYRLDTGAFVLWKSHNVRVLALSATAGAPAKSAPQPQPQSQEGIMIAEKSNRTARLSDEERAARIAYVDLIDGIRADGRSVVEAVEIVAARPPYCKDRDTYTSANYMHWRKYVAKRKGAPAIRCQAAGCGKLFEVGSVKALPYCPEHVQAEKRKRWNRDKRRSLDRKAVRAGQESADKCLAAAQGACKPAAAPVQPPCAPVAESAPPTSDFGFPPAERIDAVVREAIAGLLARRPVRYDLVGRAVEIAREFEALTRDLSALVSG